MFWLNVAEYVCRNCVSSRLLGGVRLWNGLRWCLVVTVGGSNCVVRSSIWQYCSCLGFLLWKPIMSCFHPISPLVTMTPERTASRAHVRGTSLKI